MTDKAERGCKKEMNGELKEKNIRRRYIIDAFFNAVIVCTSIFSAFFICHDDLYINTRWGLWLIRCLQTGRLREYAAFLYSIDDTTNYSPLINIITVIIQCPIYLIGLLRGRGFRVVVYVGWYKCIILAVTLATVLMLRKTLRLLQHDESYVRLASILFAVSPVIQFVGIGMGQVDFLGNFLLASSLYYFHSKNYGRMACCMSLTFIVKPIPILIYFPFLLISVMRIGKKTWRMLSILLIFPVISIILSRFYFYDYKKYAEILASKFNFTGRIFEESLQNNSFFFLTVLLSCYLLFEYLIKNGTDKEVPVYLAASINFAAFTIFVGWHPQWIVYMVTILCILGGYIEERLNLLLLYAGFNFGYIIYVISGFRNNVDNTMVERSVVADILNISGHGYDMAHYLEMVFPPYLKEIGHTIVTATLILIIYLFFKICRNRDYEMIPYSQKTDNFFFDCIYIAEAFPVVFVSAATFVIHVRYAYILGLG
ncbi:glycosyltransferase 87 family protein [Lachnospiraceae bacterium C1.1]|nr:glycosyltransferase 87 family protein [Lachnospiraceae bacterium C1.1]